MEYEKLSHWYIGFKPQYPLFAVLSVLLILQQYYENRLRYLASQKAEGGNPYPHKFHVSMSVVEYIEKYGSLSNGEHIEDVTESLAGIQN